MSAPLRLSFLTAARMLADRPARFAWSALGVGFAGLVMLVELGFFTAITDSSSALAGLLDCDLVMTHAQKDHLKSGETFSRFELLALRDLPGVAAAAPLYASGAIWWNPQDGHPNHVLLLGAELSDPMLAIPGLAALRPQLRLPGGVIFDRASRPELGRVAVGQRVSLNSGAVRVAGFFQLGPNLTYEGNVLCGAETFWALTGQPAELVDFGLVRLVPGASVEAARTRIQARFPGAVLVLTPAELFARETRWTAGSTPTGVVFAFGLALGLLIGVAVCYQILYTEVYDHRRQFALIQAIGHSPRILSLIVAAEALLIGCAGCALATAASWGVYGWVKSATLLPLRLSGGRAGLVWLLIAGALGVAGSRAVQQAKRADPAQLY